MSELIDYSQSGEQAHILAILERRTIQTGKLLDIGAWDAKTFSNSRALLEREWSGVLIEPSPGPMLALLEAYGTCAKVLLIQAAVGVEPGLLRMFISRDSVSTSNVQEYERWRAAAKFDGELLVPTISVQELFQRFGGGFDFINIDTEGTSVDILRLIIETGARARVICVEHNERIVEMSAFMQTASYRLVHVNAQNAIWEWQG